jgi:hypothetical protein
MCQWQSVYSLSDGQTEMQRVDGGCSYCATTGAGELIEGLDTG